MEQEMENKQPSLEGGSVKTEFDNQEQVQVDQEGHEPVEAMFYVEPDSVKDWVQGRMSQASKPSSSVATWDGVLGSDLFRASRASSVRNIGGVDMGYRAAEEELELKFQEQEAVGDREQLKVTADFERLKIVENASLNIFEEQFSKASKD